MDVYIFEITRCWIKSQRPPLLVFSRTCFKSKTLCSITQQMKFDRKVQTKSMTQKKKEQEKNQKATFSKNYNDFSPIETRHKNIF